MSDYLQKIVYLTDSQYETLAGGGTVGSLTGLNDNYIYITDGKVSLSDFDDSFILPINKGGTGASSWASGKILVGNGSSTFSTIDKATAATGGTLVERNANGDIAAVGGTFTSATIGNLALSGKQILHLQKIQVDGTYMILGYKQSGDGVTTSQWCVGTSDLQGVVRTKAGVDLLHSRGTTTSTILDTGNYSTTGDTRYYKLDGSNTGTKLQISTQSAAYANGIQFMNSTTKKGSIGADNDGTIGIYGTKVVLRPQLDASTKGVVVTTTAMYPTDSMTLGITSNKWSTVYATTFDGTTTSLTHVTNASDGLRIKYSTTIDFVIGVGTSNANHGLYDYEASGGAKWILSAGSDNVWTFVGNVTGNVSGSSGSCTGNATTATTASKLSNTSAIGSDVKPVYFTNGGVPQATATEMVRAFTKTSAGTDLNTYYDSGMYSITGGAATNYPTGGEAYATLLTVAYRKPSGNTKPDYAWQMGTCAQNNDRLWYRTSKADTWRAWRQIVNIAANTAVGDGTTPVYITADGEVKACTAYASASVANASKISAKLATTTKTYLLGTSTAITGTAANVEMIGDTGVYLTTTAGQLNATTYLVNEKVRMEYNSTDQSLDFIFI